MYQHHLCKIVSMCTHNIFIKELVNKIAKTRALEGATGIQEWHSLALSTQMMGRRLKLGLKGWI